jgi:arylsulfatase A-like enzyme
VLIDEAGFGNPSTFSGPIDTPNDTRRAEGGLRYNRFHITALCSGTRAAFLTGRNNHAVGFGSVGELSMGFPGPPRSSPKRLHSIPQDPQGQRLQHRNLRQVHLIPCHHVRPTSHRHFILSG